MPEPAVVVKSYRNWATLRRLPDGKTELSKAMLRGEVTVHQDPAPDKPRGTDARGEALDIRSLGGGLMKFDLADAEPSGRAERPLLAARDGVKLPPRPIAVIVTEDYVIRGHELHLDQLRDFAWARGAGTLTQLAERGFLNEKGLQERTRALAAMTPEERAKEKSKKVPMTIAWSESMYFNGRTTDPQGRPAAKAEFRARKGGPKVDARSEVYRVVADEIDTWTDKPVSLASASRTKSATPSANPDDVPAPRPDAEPKAELVRLEARSREAWTPQKEGVVAINTRRDEEVSGQLIERQRIDAGKIVYDKRTGDYYVPGPGIVRLYKRSALPPDPKKPGPKQFGGWELTKVAFHKEMVGRFGAAPDEGQPEPRTADFYERVATVNGPVEKEVDDIDFDRTPPGSKYMTSDRLRITDYPPPKGVKDVAAYQIVTADGGNVVAHDDGTSINADFLNYDTQKGLFYAYGEDDRTITLHKQNGPGQPPTTTQGKAFIYNTKTKAAQPIDPFQILLVDGTGARLGPAPPPPPPGTVAPKVKPKRQPLRPPPRMNTERRDFSGR